MPAEWTVAFLLGLLSSTHCLGMCGGIAGALTFGLGAQIRQRASWLMAFNLAYNSGRITSYAAAGALVAAGAGWLGGWMDTPNRLVMSTLGALFLVAVGLHIAGWFPRFSRIESLGRPLWRRLEPHGRRLLPVQRLPQAWLFGLIWGWLPCGLVYSALLYSLTTESAWHGGLFMLFFGLGTLPMLFTVGVMASRVAAALRRPYVRRAAGLMIVALAPVPAWLTQGGVA